MQQSQLPVPGPGSARCCQRTTTIRTKLSQVSAQMKKDTCCHLQSLLQPYFVIYERRNQLPPLGLTSARRCHRRKMVPSPPELTLAKCCRWNAVAGVTIRTHLSQVLSQMEEDSRCQHQGCPHQLNSRRHSPSLLSSVHRFLLHHKKFSLTHHHTYKFFSETTDLAVIPRPNPFLVLRIYL